MDPNLIAAELRYWFLLQRSLLRSTCFHWITESEWLSNEWARHVVDFRAMVVVENEWTLVKWGLIKKLIYKYMSFYSSTRLFKCLISASQIKFSRLKRRAKNCAVIMQ